MSESATATAAKPLLVKRLRYKASRTLARFHNSNEFVRLVIGPVGSAKSSGCTMEVVMRACEQEPWKGTRRFRAAIIRNTYPELKSTTIKTWLDWMPESIGKMKWDAPISYRAKWKLTDGTVVDLEVYFIALDKPRHVKKLLSLEITMGWINECREVPKQVLDHLTARVGRYPSKRMGGPSWRGVICDTNPPDDDHWIYRTFEEEKPEVTLPDGAVVRYEVFHQPAALLQLPTKNKNEPPTFIPNPLAENIENLDGGYGYYFRQLPGKSPEWIKVYVLGQYATIADGRPVYPEYIDAIHCAKTTLAPYKGLPIILGFDFALNPACVIAQISPRGQLRILHEICAQNMGIRQFTKTLLKPFLVAHYADFRVFGRGDPTGETRAQTDEKTCYEILREEGIEASPAATNRWMPRREAVSRYLTTMIDGEPAFLLDPGCKMLRKGLLGKYRYARIEIVGEDRFKDEPVKDAFSHPQDGLQYIALGVEVNFGRNLPAVGGSGAARPVERVSTLGWQ